MVVRVQVDDTICISTDTRALNKLLAEIETEGVKYGLKLNKGKCEVLANVPQANVHFQDGTPVPRKQEVRYLGCHINSDCDVKREVNSRISTCMIVLKRLDLFWRHSNCPPRFKLEVLDAVIKSKLLYGLESAHLGATMLKKLDTFQLKGLRKKLKMDTTFVNRQNTNQRVIETANQAIRAAGGRKPIELFSAAYQKSKIKRYAKLITETADDPARATTFNNNMQARSYANKRCGRPKARWADETAKAYWNSVKHDLEREYHDAEYDMGNDSMRQRMLRHAQEERLNTSRHITAPLWVTRRRNVRRDHGREQLIYMYWADMG